MKESLLLKGYKEKVQTHLVNQFKFYHFLGQNDIPLRYAVGNEGKYDCALLVLGGYTEFIEKYGELFFYDLRDGAYTIYSYDHRGQGYSKRLLKDRQKGHVEKFDHFVDDLKLFLENVVKKERYKKIIFLAHSMGAAIGCRFQQLYPGTLDAIIGLAPMFAVNTLPLPAYVAQNIAKLAIILGQGERYIFGGSIFKEELPFENNALTSSEVRFDINREIVKNDRNLALGSPTFRWLYEAITASSEIVHDAHLLDIPFLLLQSGDERVVRNDAQNIVQNRALQCELHTIERARHELIMEQDEFRDKVLTLVRNFMQKQGVEFKLDLNS